MEVDSSCPATRSPETLPRWSDSLGESRFRTVEVSELVRRLTGVGLLPEAVLGDYRGGPLESDSETWLILARKR